MMTLRSWLAVGVACGALAAEAPAGAVSWILDGDGNWANPANWSTGMLPGPFDDVLIDVGGATVRTITHNSGNNMVRSIASAENLFVSGGSTLHVTGAYSNSAETRVGNATLQLDGTSTLNTLNMVGAGRLAGAGLVTVLGGGTNVSNTQHFGTGTTLYLGAVGVAGAGGAVRLDGGRTVEYRGGYTTSTSFADWDLDFTDAEGGGLLRNGTGSLMLDQALFGRVFASHDGPSKLENFGTWRKDRMSGSTTIETIFMNEGLVDVVNGRVEVIGPLANATNATTLSGGSWRVEARSESDLGTLWFDPQSGLESLVTNAANITLVGFEASQGIRTGATFGFGPGATITETLRHNAAGGTLSLLDGASFGSGSGVFTNEGLVLLGGLGPGFLVSSFIGASDGIVNKGEFRGIGSINFNGDFDNQGGVIRAADPMAIGAPLQVFGSGAISGGTLATDPGSRLQLFLPVPTVDVIDHQGIQFRANTPAGVVFVTTDYRNAGFGTGDAFNRIANGVIVDVRATSAGQVLSAEGLAGGGTPTPMLHFNAREGDATPFLVTITNTGSETILRGAVRTAGAPLLAVTGGDSFMITPGGTAQFGISTAGLSVGAFGGQSVVVANNFFNVADQTLSISGNIFRLAEAEVSAVAPPLVVRVGDAVTAVVGIANVALNDGFSEGLLVSASAAGALGAATPAGFILLAGQHGQVAATVDTTTAGVRSGIIDLTFQSGGEGSSGLTPIGIGGQSVGFSVQVNNRADPVFLRDGSALSFDAMLGGFVADLGTVSKGAVLDFGGFGLGNLAFGPADDLSGLVSLVSGGPWSMGSAFDIGLLAAGQVSGPFGISFNAASRGTFLGELMFEGLGTNLSDTLGEDRFARLFVRVAVADAQGVIPEPGTWAMMIAGFGAVGMVARRRRYRFAAAVSGH